MSVLPHVLSHGTCQRPPLVWCVFKRAPWDSGVRRAGLWCVWVCFLAVEETTPLRCTEALWAWFEVAGAWKGHIDGARQSSDCILSPPHSVGPREQERAVCRPQSSPQQISESTWAQFDWFLEIEWWMSLAQGCLSLYICINNVGVCGDSWCACEDPIWACGHILIGFVFLSFFPVFSSLDMSRSVSVTAAGQCRLAPLIQVILDCSHLYDYTVKLLFKLHSCEWRTSPHNYRLSIKITQ